MGREGAMATRKLGSVGHNALGTGFIIAENGGEVSWERIVSHSIFDVALLWVIIEVL